MNYPHPERTLAEAEKFPKYTIHVSRLVSPFVLATLQQGVATLIEQKKAPRRDVILVMQVIEELEVQFCGPATPGFPRSSVADALDALISEEKQS